MQHSVFMSLCLAFPAYSYSCLLQSPQHSVFMSLCLAFPAYSYSCLLQSPQHSVFMSPCALHFLLAVTVVCYNLRSILCLCRSVPCISCLQLQLFASIPAAFCVYVTLCLAFFAYSLYVKQNSCYRLQSKWVRTSV
jgi:hypothetical protein